MVHAFKAIHLAFFRIHSISHLQEYRHHSKLGTIKVNSEVKHNVIYTNISMMTYILYVDYYDRKKTYQIAFCNIKIFAEYQYLNPYRLKIR